MNLIVIYTILFGHWISDFVLQRNKKKTKGKIKNKNLKHILPHTFLYTTILTILVFILQLFNIIEPIYSFVVLLFYFITFVTHFLTDFIVTKINEKFLRKNKRHEYFVTIGFDQFLHGSILFGTLKLLYII